MHSDSADHPQTTVATQPTPQPDPQPDLPPATQASLAQSEHQPTQASDAPTIPLSPSPPPPFVHPPLPAKHASTPPAAILSTAATATATVTATVTAPEPAAAAAAPFLSSSSIHTNISAAAAPSHKRGREPSAMTDPSEAARYTPPREMFRHPTAALDCDDLSQPSQDSPQESDAGSQIDSTLHLRHHQGHQLLPDGFHGDSELDSLGQQLSIHSPEKNIITIIDHEPELDSASGQHRADLAAERDQDQDQGQDQDQEQPSVPSYGQQVDVIRHLKSKRLEEDDFWYLVGNIWYTKFRQYCTKMERGLEGVHPGQIDNSELLLNGGLRPDANGSATALPEEAWDMLVSWYGTNSAPIKRRVVNAGSALSPNNQIEYHPAVFTLYRVVEASRADDPLFARNEPETLEVSKTTKFGDLKSALLLRWNVTEPGPARFWSIPLRTNVDVEGDVIGANDMLSLGATCLQRVEDDSPIDEVPELRLGSNLVLEVAAHGVYLVPYSTPTRAFDSSMSFGFPRSPQGSRASNLVSSEVAVNGVCGLSNLGNTCFMNSALQCLSNTPDLTRYILAGAWRDELNIDNPLGMGGEVARAYANLIDKLWNGSSKVFTPREFKSTIGRFAPSFTGYHQHDSQELLAFLLDGLHEDLNRIVKKPYTEVPDSNGRPDDEVASDCWEIHKARNDSIIVDLFQGQYKSTLVCPECEKVSVTFDPFMYLSLPLPISKKWIGTVTYVPYDPEKPVVDIRLQLPKGSTQKQLKERVAELMGTQASHLYSAEIFSHRIYRTHDNSDAVDELADGDKTFIYELPVPNFTNALDHVVFPVHGLMEPLSTYSRINTFGHPMMVCVTKEEALDPDVVYKAIVKQAARYTSLNLYEGDSGASVHETESAQQLDVNMSPPEELPREKMPKSGLFRLMVYSPPVPQSSRYQIRALNRSTLYAPSITPTMADLQDMYQRVLPQEPEPEQELESFRTYNRSRCNVDEDEDDYTVGFARPGSPSTLSGSSRSSSRPRVPQPDGDELSEEDDPATLSKSVGMAVRMPNYTYRSSSPPAPVAEPAVRQGEMVYCVWVRSLESAVNGPERKYKSYRSMDEDEDHEPPIRALWDERGPAVIDPVLQEEFLTEKRGKKTITLEDCLNEYTKEEQLGEEDLWYCPNCKKHQQATKKLDIWRLPDILVVHLKRFSHTRAWRDKIDALVDFPIHGLDLSAKALKEEDRDENVYDLFGVSNHMGGLGGGHYTAYAKNEKSDQWYNFDDSHVSPVGNVESIKSSSAYLLFYRRRNAVARQYEQRPVAVQAEREVRSVPQFHGGYLEPSSIRSIRLRDKEDEEYGPWGKSPSDPDKEDEEEYGPWGKPPLDLDEDYSPFRPLGDTDDDMDLPPYSPAIGPSGIASPPSSFSGRLTFASDKRHGKGRSADEDEDLEEVDTPMAANMSSFLETLDPRIEETAHSPDLSTCASDGSNPGTANVSPGLPPAALTSFSTDIPQAVKLPAIRPSYLSSISREGGRIDDAEDMVDTGDQANLGAGAGIPTPASTVSGATIAEAADTGEETEGEDGEQDGVNMVQWQEVLPRS